VIVGSGLGVVSDTQNFLENMLDDDEQFLTPTSFIQSTHNTPAAHIAARMKCHAYNFTYINRGHSFENALQDAFMQTEDGKNNILVGGSDEMTEQYFRITQKGGWWKKENIESGLLYESETVGALCGEGSHFFVLSGEKNSKSQSQISDLQTYTGEKRIKEIAIFINKFLSKNKLQLSDIDLVLSGNSGDVKTDPIYQGLNADYFSQQAVAGFKHLCGEHHTASAFALWLANAAVYSKRCPALMQGKVPKQINTVLIYNHFFNINHSLFLIKKA
jgi:3-oxoacyl-(acyl-carrier-protein) synthase